MLSWKERFIAGGAWFENEGDKKIPHPIYTSGRHGAVYFNSHALSRTNWQKAVKALAENVRQEIVDRGMSPDAIAGPLTGGARLAVDLGKQIRIPRGRGNCIKLHGVRLPKDRAAAWRMLPRYANGRSRFLFADDVISTGGSVLRSVEACQDHGVEIIPLIATLANHSGKDVLIHEDRAFIVISLVSEGAKTWTKTTCPLCELGSRALNPKDNWARFVPSR